MNKLSKTDSELVADYLAGEEAVLEELVEKYLKPLYNFVYQLTHDSGAAEDIVQDVFVKMWKNLDSFDREKKFSTWIFAIAKNAALDWLKKKRSFSFSFFSSEAEANGLDEIEDDSAWHGNDLLELIDNRKDIEKLLSTISSEAKTILLLHQVHGFSLMEVSQIMGQSSNTTKSKYRRAILNLRKLVGGTALKTSK